MRFLSLIAFFITLFFPLPSCASLDLSQTHEKIGQAMEVYEDAGGKMTFSHIQNLPQDAFTPLDASVDAHLFTTSTFWYRFEVTNTTKAPLERLITVEIPWIDHIGIHVLSENISSYTGGNTYPYAQRSVDHRFPNFLHSFSPGTSVVYIEVRTRDPFIVPVSIFSPMAFAAINAHDANHAGFIYGFVAAMLLYNLFLFISIKARSYAFYALYLGAFLAMNMSYNGYTFKLLFPTYPDLQNWAQSTSIFLFSICGLLFAHSFLNLKTYSPFLHRGTLGVIVLFVATMMLTPLAGYHYHVMFSIAYAVLFSLYTLSIAVYSLAKGNHSAKFFILGTIAGLIGTAITALTVMALIPYSDWGYKAVDYGMVIDTVLLSLALADRMRITQEEKQRAEKEAKTDTLTGLLNRKAYGEITLREQHRAQRYGTGLSLIMVDVDHFKQINDTYGHAAGDKVLKQVASIIDNECRESDHIFRLGGDEFLILLPETLSNDAIMMAERIRSESQNGKIRFERDEITVTLSLGIAEFLEDDSIESAIKRADKALYRAKSGGRNRSSL